MAHLAPDLGARPKHLTLHRKWGQGKMEKTIHSNAYRVLRQWLVEMRHEKRLTQRELARLLKVPYSWVGKVELGERRLDIVEYVRLCKGLGIDPHEGLELIINQLKNEEEMRE